MPKTSREYPKPRRLSHVELIFHFHDDDETIEAQIDADEGTWSQWHATTSELGENVDRLDAMAKALMGAGS